MATRLFEEQFLKDIEENIGIIIKIARVYAKNTPDREDLINDIVFELWKSYQRFNGNSSISTWIYRVALNTSMNYKRKRENDDLLFFTDFKNVDNEKWLIEDDNSSETQILFQCIEELNEINKAIILLYLDGKSHEEIAEITGVSKSNVGTRIGRIKEQIKNLAISKI